MKVEPIMKPRRQTTPRILPVATITLRLNVRKAPVDSTSLNAKSLALIYLIYTPLTYY
jgi:hypothetical protein